MTEATPSFLSRVQNTTGFLLLLTILSSVLYMQDIFQDILVISGSISSQETYFVLYTLKVNEKSLGYFMACVFGFSVLVVGWDTIVKARQLILIKTHPWIHVLLALACLLNLGPVFFIFVHFVIKTKRIKSYVSEKEIQRDERTVQLALSTTKTKEALCENLPMLVIVCFKTSLSSRISVLEIVSSASSAILLSKMMIAYVAERAATPLGLVKKLFGSLTLGTLIYVTLVLITTFAIESERDGILISVDPKRGSEDSAGLVLILLIFPTIFFCFIPFSIYDLIPFLFHDSAAVWEYFQKPPRRIWYLSILLCSFALSFNLLTATYLLLRDTIDFMTIIEPYHTDVGCATAFMGLRLPSIICNQYYLTIGAGRVYFKAFLILAIVTTMVAYVTCVKYILGMRHRDRADYRYSLEAISAKQLAEMLADLREREMLDDLTAACAEIREEEEKLIRKVKEEETGEIRS